MFKNVSIIVLIILLLLAILMEPLVLGRIGGISTVMLGVAMCLLIASYKRDDTPFLNAVNQVILANKGLFFLLACHYFWVIIGYFRDLEGVSSSEVKQHMTFIFSLFLGLFLVVNKKYSRFLIFMMVPLMLYHTFTAKSFIDYTGEELRDAITESGGLAFGHTYYWSGFAMLILILFGQLLDEKKVIIKIVGAMCLIPLYYIMLTCSFATPIAAFLIGHILFGLAYFRFGKKGAAQFFIRLAVFAGLLIGSVYVAYQLSQAEDEKRPNSIQSRFQSMIEDPRGGGYSGKKESRFALILISIDTFKRNPIFGCGGGYLGNPQTGGHQAIADYLALYGIVGGGPFILFVFLCFRNAGRRCKQEQSWVSYGRFAATGIYVIIGIVNPAWMGQAVVPFLLLAQPFKLPKQHLGLNQPKPRTQMSNPTHRLTQSHRGSQRGLQRESYRINKPL